MRAPTAFAEHDHVGRGGVRAHRNGLNEPALLNRARKRLNVLRREPFAGWIGIRRNLVDGDHAHVWRHLIARHVCVWPGNKPSSAGRRNKSPCNVCIARALTAWPVSSPYALPFGVFGTINTRSPPSSARRALSAFMIAPPRSRPRGVR